MNLWKNEMATQLTRTTQPLADTIFLLVIYLLKVPGFDMNLNFFPLFLFQTVSNWVKDTICVNMCNADEVW